MLHDITFSLDRCHTLAILGTSGCGKTTLLKIMAGLLEGEGGIRVDGQDIRHLPPQARGVVYLYQEALLFPHLDVFENVAFGLRLRKQAESSIQEEVMNMLAALELEDQVRKMPGQLSGGQKQRVAFGRALIIRPRLLLLDEPFGNLDVETRATMQDLFKRLAAEQNITAVVVTHDLKEAVRMGDRWGYMTNGTLVHYDSLHTFTADERTGMQNEIQFWKNI